MKKIYNLQSLNFLQNLRMKVGILGGSFNPAHEGHLLISNQAIKLLNLDYVIWLVAKQNPLKLKYESSIERRAIIANNITKNPRILISTAELDIKSPYIYDILSVLCNKFHLTKFYWLMGADNISDFHKWYRYQDINSLCNIVIFDRPKTLNYLNFSKFSFKFNMTIAKRRNISTNSIECDTKRKKNAIFYPGTKVNISSSIIRSEKTNVDY